MDYDFVVSGSTELNCYMVIKDGLDMINYASQPNKHNYQNYI